MKLSEMGFGNDRTQTSTASQVKRKRDAPSDQDVYYEERLRRMILESAWRECYERYEGRMKAMDDQLAILRSEVEFVRSKVARTESQVSPGIQERHIMKTLNNMSFYCFWLHIYLLKVTIYMYIFIEQCYRYRIV